MDILTTSLEALLQRATNPNNECEDVAAVEAFCGLVNKETEGVHISVRLLAARLHSRNEKEVLQTLHILDMCMKKCGNTFHAEVGKFRFLNEMIKLVSPKYLGHQTPFNVKQTILELLLKWTMEYTRETKIKEAYEMLKKQGVVKEDMSKRLLNATADNSFAYKASAPASSPPTSTTSSIFQDEDKSKLLQKLLQSKDPEDLQAANRLIKIMVKEDDKRAELKSKRITELEQVHNNVRLLNEMLDSYRNGISSGDELDLINELHQSCERLRPNVYRLVTETQQNEEMLNQVFQVNDELTQIFEKYNTVIVEGNNQNSSLLDLGLSQPEAPASNCLDTASAAVDLSSSNLDVLCDIFSTSATTAPSSDILNTSDILQATSRHMPMNASSFSLLNTVNQQQNQSKTKDDRQLQQQKNTLDELSESLLKEYLMKGIPNNVADNKSAKDNENVSLDQLVKRSDVVVEEACNNILKEEEHDCILDDFLVELSQEQKIEDKPKEKSNAKVQADCGAKQTLPLTDLYVKLEDVKPSPNVAPLPVLDTNSGISVTLHFAKDKPRDDVSVVVVTTLNKSASPITCYLFQAVVPKSCKIKLQSPSSTQLPAHNPFLPPSAITQILLISNPSNISDVSLKFIVSFVMDEETVTEMGEAEKLPIV